MTARNNIPRNYSRTTKPNPARNDLKVVFRLMPQSDGYCRVHFEFEDASGRLQYCACGLQRLVELMLQSLALDGTYPVTKAAIDAVADLINAAVDDQSNAIAHSVEGLRCLARAGLYIEQTMEELTVAHAESGDVHDRIPD